MRRLLRARTGWLLLGSALVLAAVAMVVMLRPPERPWNVLLVTFDTTRADHIESYGARRSKTPTLSRLAAEGFQFDRAFSTAPITGPSHSTILTGLYPVAHGFRDNGLFVLGDEQVTLAEVLKDNGYVTAAAVGAFPVTARFGFDQGFDLFDDHLTGLVEDHLGERIAAKQRLFFDERRAAQVNEAVLPWLQQQAAGESPFFLWVHYFDPHQPFEPPSPYDRTYADDLYSGEISYTDASLGRLLDFIDGLGELERTLVVMTADHGEGLGEHNEVTHAVLAYNSTLRVPLIIRPPPSALQTGRVIDDRVGNVDIPSTVFDLLDIEGPSGLHGRSLLPLMRDGESEWRQYYAENLSPYLTHGWGKLRVLFEGSYKYIHGPRPELYDIEADPDELENLAWSDPERTAQMHEQLDLFIKDHATGVSAAAVLDDESKRRLQSLGYLQGGGEEAAVTSEALESGGIPPHENVSLINDMSAAKHLLFRQRYADAQVYTRRLLEVSPDSPAYIEMHMSALAGTGEVEAAWQLMSEQRAVATPPSEALLLLLVSMRFETGRQDEAVTVLHQHATEHDSARAWWLLASLVARMGDRSAAADHLRAALAADPGFAPAGVDLAVRLAQDGAPTQAEAQFLQALHASPHYAKGHYNYGAFLHSERRFQEAAAHFERALQLAPNYAAAHLGAIAASIGMADLPAARRSAEALRRRLPQSTELREAEALLREAEGAAAEELGAAG